MPRVPSRNSRAVVLRCLALVGLALAVPATGRAQAFAEATALKSLTLEELLAVEVVSVSRKAENSWTAPGAIDVVSGDEIRRSGALSLPDSLRLASGVDVMQPVARSWGIGMRGFTLPGGNKINALVDGRALYTPFYSGIFWDAQDVMLADVDRIEVMRGPVGALWGAYAVNGLIQIFSKSAWDTQGGLASWALTSNHTDVGNIRYGGLIDGHTAYRVYAQYRQFAPTFVNGQQAEAASDFGQTGFRVDRDVIGSGKLTVSGDYYSNQDLFLRGSRDIVTGANLNAQWQAVFSSGRDAQVQSYFDYTSRRFAVGLSEVRRTYQLNGKYHLASGRHDLVLGTDNSVSSDTIGNIAGALVFDPAHRVTHSLGAYANYTYTFVPHRLATTVAAKVEHNSFTGFEVQPTWRLAWTPSPRTTVWTAVSRGVRTPVRFDQDVNFPGAFAANNQFRSEEVWAFELGVRRRISTALAVDTALFWNNYDRLRSYQPIGTALIPLTFRNMLNAQAAGAEVTALLQASSVLQLKASYRYLAMDFWQDPGSRNPFGTRYEANDPRHMGTVSAQFDLPHHLEFSATVRGASSRPFRESPGYVTADASLGWPVTAQWRVDVIGRNLLRPYLEEAILAQNTTGPALEMARSIAVRVTYRF